MKLTKKIFSAVTAAVCTLTVCFASISVGVSADVVPTPQGITYRTHDDHVEVIECDASASAADIPTEIYDLPVTVIANMRLKTVLILQWLGFLKA